MYLKNNIDGENATLLIKNAGEEFNQKFDAAFGQDSKQIEVYAPVSECLQQTLRGVNLTVFAYGQTGSGKTYTMFGADNEQQYIQQIKHQRTQIDDLSKDENNAGIIPRVIHELFQNVQQDHFVYCSFLQIYNEKIYDLLGDPQRSAALQLHETKSEGIFVDGLSEYAVTNAYDCLQLMRKGERYRTIRSTSMNAKSSRSHTIFQILIESNQVEQGKLKRSKINLCDLAGSEKVDKMKDINQAHMQELKNINQSLTTLGKVIQFLSKGSKLPIPYRESKLTRLLQDSLGGNTQTILFANIAPGVENLEESFSTLKFAERAKNIQIVLKANEISVTDSDLVNKLQKEIAYLRQMLALKRNGVGAHELHQKLLKLQEENEKLKIKSMQVLDVEEIMRENRDMKMEIEKMQGAMTRASQDGSSTTGNEFLPPIFPKLERKKRLQADHNSSYDLGHTVHKNVTRQSESPFSRPCKRPFNVAARLIFQTQEQPRLKLKENHNNQSGPIESVNTKNSQLKREKQQVLERLERLDRIRILNQKRIESIQSDPHNFHDYDRYN